MIRGGYTNCRHCSKPMVDNKAASVPEGHERYGSQGYGHNCYRMLKRRGVLKPVRLASVKPKPAKPRTTLVPECIYPQPLGPEPAPHELRRYLAQRADRRLVADRLRLIRAGRL